MKKIVVLDGYTLNPGDLNWSKLEALGELKVYDRTTDEELFERCRDAEIILTNKTVLNSSIIEQLDKLEYIGIMATGYNVVDIDSCRKKGVTVTNAAGYSTPFVAQHTFALILELCNQVGLHNAAVHDSEWTNCPDFSFAKTPLTELDGKILGIIGLGTIGRAVAAIAQAFGMRVIAYHTHTEKHYHHLEYVSFEECLKRADIVSLHCPLKDNNHAFINKKALSNMKPSAFLINTARGPLINEKDLAEMLNTNKIAGAALDVLSTEPPLADNPLLSAKNCIITPHIAWASKAARERLMAIVVNNIKAFYAGQAQNVIA